MQKTGGMKETNAQFKETAKKLAMLEAIVSEEPNFAAPMVSPEAGVARAICAAQTATRPVVIADTQDNPGCGGTADATGLLKALVAANAQGAVLGFLCDADAARAAHAAGEGAQISLALGGRSGPQGVTPFEGNFRVARLGDGQFKSDGAVSGGRKIDVGPIIGIVAESE